MKNRFTTISICLIVLLTSCGPVTPLPTNDLPTSTPLPIPTSTITPLLTIPLFTPTFDVSRFVTATYSPKAECPKENPDLVASFSIPDQYSCETVGGWCNADETAEEILSFLNQGGAISAVTARLEKINKVSGVTGGNFSLADLTNDSVPELILQDYSVMTGIFIFTCNSGKYKLFPAKKGRWMNIRSIEDLNRNGIPELIVSGGGCSGSGCVDFGIFEWNGNTHRDLSESNIWIDGPKSAEIKDYNSDGLKDVILTGDHPGSCCMDLMTPWRYKTIVFSWNGDTYSESYVTFDKAQYRFQAIQDADREVVYGNYDIALAYYQEAIFNNTLGWWTKERRDYEVKLFYDSFAQLTPTPSPYPKEDPSEYPRLAAYAYYRIMLLHIVRGFDSDAVAIYNTLQQDFPSGNPGHSFAEMAAAFWNDYQASHNITTACDAAIEYAAENVEILVPLGSDYHGIQSHNYKAEDVCPFR